MRKFMLAVGVVLSLFLVPVNVIAQEVQSLGEITITATPEDAGVLVQEATQAFTTGHVAIGMGALIMLAIWATRKVVPSIPKLAAPWAAMVLGMAGYIGQALAAGGDWKQALIHGFLAGASAIGLWELIFNRIDKNNTPPTA